MTTPMERMALAYAANAEQQERERLEEKREGFQEIPEFEYWIECIEKGLIEPSPQMRMQLGIYLREKEEAA